MEDIYENSFIENENLRDQFLKREGKDYKLLNKVGVSTLFRLKREVLNEKKDVDKIKRILVRISERTENFDKKSVNKNKEKPTMYFSFDKEYRINANSLEENFIDSVIVFYKYRLAYKKMNKSRGGKNGN